MNLNSRVLRSYAPDLSYGFTITHGCKLKNKSNLGPAFDLHLDNNPRIQPLIFQPV